MNLIDFFNHPFFAVVGSITVLCTLVALLIRVFCWFFKVTPIVFKFGISLLDRKIAIFASQEVFNELKNCLIDSKIFQEKNIVHIQFSNLDKAKKQTIFLVDWESFKDKIDEIFVARRDEQVPIVVYAKPASIPNDKMSVIANKTNTVVVNFRGRLLNDIVTSLVTTTYESN
ncbi:hypothetical protein MASR1M68_00200 [Elusimicrobiota bacterium]